MVVSNLYFKSNLSFSHFQFHISSPCLPRHTINDFLFTFASLVFLPGIMVTLLSQWPLAICSLPYLMWMCPTDLHYGYCCRIRLWPLWTTFYFSNTVLTARFFHLTKPLVFLSSYQLIDCYLQVYIAFKKHAVRLRLKFCINWSFCHLYNKAKTTSKIKNRLVDAHIHINIFLI